MATPTAIAMPPAISELPSGRAAHFGAFAATDASSKACATAIATPTHRMLLMRRASRSIFRPCAKTRLTIEKRRTLPTSAAVQHICPSTSANAARGMCPHRCLIDACGCTARLGPRARTSTATDVCRARRLARASSHKAISTRFDLWLTTVSSSSHTWEMLTSSIVSASVAEEGGGKNWKTNEFKR